jgi:hypothetical protein
MITPPLEEDFVFLELETEDKKDNNKGIPAKVMLNHFAAIRNHIYGTEGRHNLNAIPFFKNKLQRNPATDKKRVKQLLYNSWNTEKLLRQTSLITDENYLRTALHWSFVQLYYSAYLNMFAFYTVKSINCRTHEAILKQFASLVKNSSYPVCISFFADGEMKKFEYKNLILSSETAKSTPFETPQNSEQYAKQIATFLKTTREKKAHALKDDRQAHEKTALRTSEGKILTKYKPEHWKQITEKMGITTIFDLLYRQRIKANYQDIENLMYANDEIREFHHVICDLLHYLNFVHEAYIAKIAGIKEMREIVRSFSDNFDNEKFVSDRFQNLIEPLF